MNAEQRARKDGNVELRAFPNGTVWLLIGGVGARDARAQAEQYGRITESDQSEDGRWSFAVETDPKITFANLAADPSFPFWARDVAAMLNAGGKDPVDILNALEALVGAAETRLNAVQGGES